GTKPSIDIDDMQCSYIPTGGMLPVGADSVVMIEDAEDLDDEVLINKSVSVNENVVSSNEDISCGDVVIKAGEIINSTLIAILISLDIRHVKVRRFIKAGVISTGDELLGINETIQVPKIKDTNGPYLTAALREDGCISTHYGILKDNEDNILSTVKKALSENDIVFMSGGSSAGNKDFTEKVMTSLGELMFHGLAIKPGKPTLMARCNEDKFIIGLPGHPLACTIVYRFIISKLINKLMGKNTTIIEHTVEISENYHKARGREEYLPVIIRGEIAYPLHAKSSAMSVMARCNGVIRIDRDVEGIQKGEKVKVMR
ncbi:MAG: molybdopterin molybdotransferase MoeA, partial [Clostridium sp.]